MCSLLLISNSYQAFMTSTITYFSNMQCYRLQVRLLENYLMQRYSFFLTKNPSDLGKNILVEVSRVTSGFIMQLLLVLSKIIIALFLFSLLFLHFNRNSIERLHNTILSVARCVRAAESGHSALLHSKTIKICLSLKSPKTI